MSPVSREITGHEAVKATDSISPEMRSFMTSQLGLNEESIQSITPDSEFSSGLQNLMANPENQTERMIFLGRYIYDRVIAEAQKQGKDPLKYAKEQKKDSNFLFDLGDYISERKNNAAITDEERIAKKNNAAITDEERIAKKKEELIEKNKLVEKYTSLAKGELSSYGEVMLSAEVNKAKQDEKFIKKLEEKGYKKEDIQSDKFNDTITGYVLAEREQEFIAKGYIKDIDKFQSAITNTRDVLGIPKTLDRNFENLPIANGPRRDQIISEGSKIIESGKYNEKNITYNSETGRIRFESKNPNSPNAEIDTSRIPPTLEYTRGGLRISREIQPITPEERTSKEKTAELTDIRKKTQSAEENYVGLTGKSESAFAEFGKQNKDNNTISASLQMRQDLMKEYRTGDASKKLEVTNKLIANNADIKKQRLDLIQLDKPVIESIERATELEGFALHDLQKNLTEQGRVEQELKAIAPNIPKSKDDGFENNANYNLNFLSKIGYDGIGQDNMERIIRTLNSPENPSRSSVGEIDLNQKLDTPKTQSLTLAITNLVRNGRTSTGQPTEEQKKTEESQRSWDSVDKSDPYIAARQTQSLGFRESLSSVARNMSQEGGSLKTDSAMKKVLFGINPQPEATSAINTKA